MKIDIVEYLITTAIAVAAFCVAWSAKRQAREVASDQMDMQERLEVYNHYPIPTVSIEGAQDGIGFKVANINKDNAVRDYELGLRMVIYTRGGGHSVEVDEKINGGEIFPLSVESVHPSKINESLGDSLAFIKRLPQSDVHIVVRASLNYGAPHPSSPRKHEECVGYLSYGSDGFEVHPDPVSKIAEWR